MSEPPAAPESRPQLRPLGIGEIFDVGINIYRRNARVLITLVLLVVGPIQVLSSLIQASTTPDSGDPLLLESETGELTTDDEFWRALAGFGIAGLLGFIAGTVATGACFKAVADGYVGNRAEWRPALGYAARRLHSILWVTFLGGFLSLLGLILLIVGVVTGAIIGPYYARLLLSASRHQGHAPKSSYHVPVYDQLAGFSASEEKEAVSLAAILRAWPGWTLSSLVEL